MNILWITNGLLPEATEILGGAKELKGSGSWILALAERLIKIPNVTLTIATVDNQYGDLVRIKGEKINYYLIHGGRRGYYKINHSLEPYWKIINDEVKPDVIHIHGTEYTHGLAWLEACGADRTCVSLQGLISVIGHFYSYGLSREDRKIARLHYLLFNRGVYFGEKTFIERSESEIELLKRVKYIIGRTNWDKAHAWTINPNMSYYYGGEILRKEFYDEESWSYKNCTPHSIFLSQGEYPLKGLLPVLRAIPLVRRSYPDVILRVAGRNIMESFGFRDYLNNGDYRKMVKHLIKNNSLENNVVFTGPLNAQDIKKEYLKANVFICPSSIENSPNSLCEAQALGVPVLASYAGGIPDLMIGEENNLYRFEETEVLALKICQLFEEKDNIDYTQTRNKVLQRHNPAKIITDLVNVYNEIIGK